MKQSNVRILSAGLVAVLAVLVLAFHALAAGNATDGRLFGRAAMPAQQDAAPQAEDDALAATNCRYGVGYVPDLPASLAWIPTLDAGWYITFGAYGGSGVRSASFAPVIRVRQEILPGGARTNNFSVIPPLSYNYIDDQGVEREGLGTLISRNRGHYWLVGNEVDVNNFVQDNTMPQVYARAYHDIYHYIKRVDPTAKVAIAGLSMMTPGRRQYLDFVWNEYRAVYGQDMPVDIWNMHLYILEERNPGGPNNEYGDGKIALGTDPALAKLSAQGNASLCPAPGAPDTDANDPRLDVYCRSEHDSVRIFMEQVKGMREWMKAHGQQNKPLIISEFGLLYAYVRDDNGQYYVQDEHGQPFAPARATEYLRDTIAYLENAKDVNLGYPADSNRLVQQWLWYSIVTDPESSGGSSNLINWDTFQTAAPGDPAALTMMGQAFQQAANASANWSNLVGGVAQNVVTLARQGGKGSALLTASFRNSGTMSVIAPVTVTFYADQALTQVIGSAVYDPNTRGAVTGCSWGARNGEHVSVMWSNLPVGTHNYWAKIDPANTIGETSDTDNVTTMGTVTVRPYGTYVPLTSRQ
jgi:hypothetical protein